MEQMKRRELIALLGGAAIALPLAALAQRADRTRRIGVLMGLAENDPVPQERLAAFREQMQKLGWSEASNFSLITRWAGGDVARTRTYASELVALAPDVILVNTPPGLAALQTATKTIPVVFVQVVGAGEGAVASPARPGGNITGFYTFFEYSMAGKWLQMLKEAAPRLKRAAVMQNPKHPAWTGYVDAARNAASPLGIEVTPAAVEEPAAIEQIIAKFAREPDGGLILPPDPFTTAHRGLVVAAAARHRLPAIGHLKAFAAAGGLMSYGADLVDLFRQAAPYADRILRGQKPARLPIQASTKFELVVNLKTAKALGIAVPQSLLLRADQVIE